MRYFKDEGDGYYIVTQNAKPLPNWTEITQQQYDDANPKPEPVIPSVVTMKQAQLALFRAGLLDAVESAIAAGGREDQITWAKSQTVERSDPLVTNMAAALSLTEADLDDLFTLAATL